MPVADPRRKRRSAPPLYWQHFAAFRCVTRYIEGCQRCIGCYLGAPKPGRSNGLIRTEVPQMILYPSRFLPRNRVAQPLIVKRRVAQNRGVHCRFVHGRFARLRRIISHAKSHIKTRSKGRGIGSGLIAWLPQGLGAQLPSRRHANGSDSW